MDSEGPSPGVLGPNSIYVLREPIIWGCNEVVAGKGKFKTHFFECFLYGRVGKK